jgi:hypothetical protein
VDAWQDEMARVMREEMQRLGRPHLLSGQQAFTYGAKNLFPLDATFAGKTFDIVNVHPLPETNLNGHVYDMGNFMSKELRLDQVAGFCKAAFPLPKPTVLDEDNTASMYRDVTGWTIHRKRAWAALMNGCHYDYIAFPCGRRGGTPASQRGFTLVASFRIHGSLDFVNAEPARLDRSEPRAAGCLWSLHLRPRLRRLSRRCARGHRSLSRKHDGRRRLLIIAARRLRCFALFPSNGRVLSCDPGEGE